MNFFGWEQAEHLRYDHELMCTELVGAWIKLKNTSVKVSEAYKTSKFQAFSKPILTRGFNEKKMRIDEIRSMKMAQMGFSRTRMSFEDIWALKTIQRKIAFESNFNRCPLSMTSRWQVEME